jgi:hypothetical protein
MKMRHPATRAQLRRVLNRLNADLLDLADLRDRFQRSGDLEGVSQTKETIRQLKERRAYLEILL